VLLTTGTIGFRLLTGASWLDAAYLAVVTLTTVGSRDPAVTPAAEVFTIAYLLGSLTFFSYGAFQIGQLIVNADFGRLWERRKMDHEIAKLNRHFIVCGLGRMGMAICQHLSAHRQSFVVVDCDRALVEGTCKRDGWPYIHGDATHDETLKAAGIDRARALATVLPTDADNVYVVLTARMLSPALQIVARANDDGAIQKLERAGATRVISPFSSGAVKMARLMLNPSMEDFLEISDSSGADLELADVQVCADSPLVGKRLTETGLHDRGIMVLAMRRVSGERLLPPGGSTVIQAGDSLYVFGAAGDVNAMLTEASPLQKRT
jgi:voltage-gated potassium channel